MNVDDNWIETEAGGPNRTSWTIICKGKVVHAEEQSGDDPSGAKAFEAGLQWAAVHCPAVQFHWRHRSQAATPPPLREPAPRDRAPSVPGVFASGRRGRDDDRPG